MTRKTVYKLLLSVMTVIMSTTWAQAGVFGEVALSVGSTFPQGNFTRYADPGVMGALRVTAHIPGVEMFAVWFDFGGTGFSSESFETEATVDGVRILGITQTTSESMVTSHLGLQLATMTRRAFFRPRAALGVGLYHFSTTTTWNTDDLADTTITLDSETEDSQTSFGWRGTIGADLFVTTNIGITADFVYDHVFNLNQAHGPKRTADHTSRFHGFTVGVVYMFSTD